MNSKTIDLCLAVGIFLSGISQASSQPSDVLPNNGAFVLTPQSAFLERSSDGKSPPAQLLPVNDGDGVAEYQMLAPVGPAVGSIFWTVEAPKSERYVATLEYAHARNGNSFELLVGNQTVFQGDVPGTLGNIALVELGEIELPSGPQKISLKNISAPQNIFLNVVSLHLRPLSGKAMKLSDVRVAVDAAKSLKLPSGLLLPRIFSDHMVLQRGMPVPVWGRAVPQSQVTVTFAGQSKVATADATGWWMLRLNPLEAGGPFAMEVSDGSKKVGFSDVLVGEVWFGSGQSNMEVSVNDKAKTLQYGRPVFECDEETKQFIDAGVDPRIRISSITKGHSKDPAWVLLNAENCRDAPATMTCAAILLLQKFQVPVGIVVRAENSSPAGIWLSREAVEADVDLQKELLHYRKSEYPRLLTEYPAKLKEFEDGKVKAKPPVPPQAADSPTAVFVEGRVQSCGVAYRNQIAPAIPYAVRGIVWDQGESKEGIQGASMSTVLPALVRSWRSAWGQPDLPFFYFQKNQHPQTLSSAMESLGHTFRIDNAGLKQETHPPDKLAYARRLFEAMNTQVYDKPATH